MLRRRDGSDWYLAIALVSLGEVERCASDDARAEPLFSEALAIFRGLSAEAQIAWSLHNLGHIALRAGDRQAAAPLFTEALTIRHRHKYAHGIASELAAFGELRALAGDYEAAARLFGAAEALLERAHSVLAPADQAAFERATGMLRAQQGDLVHGESWEAGCAFPADEAVAEALAHMP